MSLRRGASTVIAAAALFAIAPPAVADNLGPGAEWSPISPPEFSGQNLVNTNEIGVVRTADDVLHVLWVNQRDDGTQELLHTPVTGTKTDHPGNVGDATTVMTVSPAANQSFNDRVDLTTTTTGGLRALFATTFPGSPIDGILATSTAAADGAVWTGAVPASATAQAERSPVYAASGIGAGADLQGVVTGTWGDSSPDGGGYRVGLSSNGADSRFPLTLGDIDPDVATDSVTGETFIAVNRQDIGINLISLTGGDGGTVPQSVAAWTLQRTSITGRIGAPGVYVGYGTGDNMFSARPAIYRVGAEKFIFLKNQPDAANVGIAAAPEGRLWVYWTRDGNLFASRTNRDVTQFGAIVKYPPPLLGDDTIYRLAGEASLGSLDLFALADTGAALSWWVERIPPGLKLEVLGSGTVKAGKKVQFLVTDAGDPVKGIKVYVVIHGKHISKATNASGKAKIKIPKDADPGNEKAFTEPDDAYSDAKGVSFNVKN